MNDPQTDPETVIINGEKYGIMAVSEAKTVQQPDYFETRFQIPTETPTDWRVLYCMKVK